ncbi:MAG: hypothetical protein K5878_01850 [Rhizobiaceae bacterium]|nr:hypothetical protein [Rhizobiaceae bacterium]
MRDYAVVVLTAALGLAFLLLGAFIAAARRYGAIEASIGFGVGFLLIAGIVLVYHKVSSRRRQRRAERRRSTEVKSIAGVAAVTALPLLLRGGLGVKALILPLLGLAALAVLREQGMLGGDDDEDVPGD